MFRAEAQENLIPPDPKLGRWIWKASCMWCGDSFGGYEYDHTDPLKSHAKTCWAMPDNCDDG